MGKPKNVRLDVDAEPSLEAEFRPLDRRRLKEIRAWLEGGPRELAAPKSWEPPRGRPDAPTPAELDEFLTWVALEIEWHLARHQPVQDLLKMLNAAREQRHTLAKRTTKG